jgi:hypothetical protein
MHEHDRSRKTSGEQINAPKKRNSPVHRGFRALIHQQSVSSASLSNRPQ